MDVTPTRMGASVVVDVTAEAWTELLERLAASPRAVELLVQMAEAKSALKNLKVAAANGRPVSDERIEQVACEVDGLREQAADLVADCRVKVEMTAAGCRQDAGKLNAAAEAAEKRFRTPGQVRVPRQWNRGDAA